VANDQTFQMRISRELIERVDQWRRAQKDIPSRAAAIRRLVEAALTHEKTRGKR
jgi:hypothetical protein